MYSSLPTDQRQKHPYHMYEEIKAQPQAVGRSLSLAAQHAPDVLGALGRARRVFLTGCGTSLHAAQGGAWLLRSFTRGRIDAQAIPAYELVTYLFGLGPGDAVLAVTHSGATTMTLRALERARRCGADTLVVTGFPASEAADLAHHVLPTGYADEKSWAHTASYTSALTTLAALANDLAHSEERLDLSPLPEIVLEALQIEEMAHRVAAGALVAERYRGPARFVVVGAGPNAITAQEAVLKLLETSYIQASAFELEQMLHGPLAAVTPDTLVLVLAPPGGCTDRATELVRAARTLGTTPVVLVGSDNAESFPEAHRLLLPDLPEALSPIPYIVPLQFLAYFLAVGKGLNPDLLHRDDERYRAARACYP